MQGSSLSSTGACLDNPLHSYERTIDAHALLDAHSGACERGPACRRGAHWEGRETEDSGGGHFVQVSLYASGCAKKLQLRLRVGRTRHSRAPRAERAAKHAKCISRRAP